MQVLAHAGLVVIKQGSGTYVNRLALLKQRTGKLRPTQKMLEREAVRELLNAPIDSDHWLVLKADLARRNQLLSQGRFKEFVTADIRFHTQIVRMSENPYLIKWYTELRPFWQRYLNRLIVKHRPYRGNTRYHNRLFRALVNRNVAVALKMIDNVGR